MDNPDYSDIIKERRKRIFSFRNLFFLIVSLFLVYFFLRQIDIAGTFNVIRSINPSYILIIFLLYCLSNYLKSLRFMLMLKGHHIKHSEMFAIVSYQNFFNLILPARTGELTLIYYLKKIGGLKVSKGLHSLLLSRFMDLMIVAVIFIISSYFYWGTTLPLPLLFISLIILSGSLLLVFRLGLMLDIARHIIVGFTSLPGLREKKIIQKGIDLVDKFRNAIPEYNSKTDYFLFIAVTVVIWINFYLIFYFNIKALIDGVSFLRVLIGATGAVLTNTLPVNSFGSFGTLEAGWTGGFMLVGMNLQDSILTGFAYHVMILLCAAVIASICRCVLFMIKHIKSR